MLPKTLNNIRFTSASELNRRVTLQRPGTGSDSEGTPNPPVAVATVWAKARFLPNSGRPDAKQQITQAEDYLEVTIRYRSDVKSDWTIIGPGGETWTITSINNLDFANVELRIIVRQINGGIGQ